LKKIVTTLDEFFDRCEYDADTQCVNWSWGTNGNGYGSLRFNGKVDTAHRVVIMLYHGIELTSDNVICHHCDNPICCNLAHLFIGTHKQNSDDKFRKGRFVSCPGDKNGTSKITEIQAVWMRSEWSKGGIKQRELGAIVGLTQQQVSKIVNNKARIILNGNT